jgi:hypothetical protein
LISSKQFAGSNTILSLISCLKITYQANIV